MTMLCGSVKVTLAGEEALPFWIEELPLRL